MNVSEQLRQLAAELDQREAELDQREADLAAAAELLSQDAAVAAAYAAGVAQERRRVVMEIDLQLEYLNYGGTNAVSLQTLRDRINGKADD